MRLIRQALTAERSPLPFVVFAVLAMIVMWDLKKQADAKIADAAVHVKFVEDAKAAKAAKAARMEHRP